MNTSMPGNRCSECGAPLTGAAQGLCARCLLAGAAAPTEHTAARSAPPTLEQVAAAFPQLEILELIGHGGMGAVFKVRQPKLDRCAALKLLPQSLAADPAFASRFEREAQLLARLNHANIVAVYDHGQAGEFFYLLMEYVDGVNLRQAMRTSRFTPAQALGIVPKICEALQYAHDEGVLHRDIKPENILLDAKGRVKLADFGIAKLTADRTPESHESHPSHEPYLTQAGAALGTPQYMAPEQRDTPGDVDHRADIYSLGVVFYELLTGELPVGKFAPPSTLSAADPRVDAIVQQALQKERERRQHSAGELKTQVEFVTGSAPRLESPDPTASRPSRRVAFDVAVVCFFTGLVLGILLIGALPLQFSPDSAYLLLVGVLAVVAPFAGHLASRDKAASWLGTISIVAALLTLPVLGFGIFFLFAMLTSSKPWNPAQSEAVVVPLSWLGSILLPLAAIRLRQSPVNSVAGPDLNLRGVLGCVASLLIGGLLCIGGAGIWLWISLKPDLYAATVTLEVRLDNSGPIVYPRGEEPFFLTTVVKVMQSQGIMEAVVRKLDLTHALAKDGKPISIQAASSLLARSFKIRAVGNTSLVEVTAYHRDPQLAADIANAVAVEYKEMRLNEMQQIIERSLGQLRDEVEKQRLRMEKSNEEMKVIQERDKILDPDPETMGALVSMLEGASDPKVVADYVKAKSRYLQDKQIFLAAQIKLSTEMLEKGIDFDPAIIREKATPAEATTTSARGRQLRALFR